MYVIFIEKGRVAYLLKQKSIGRKKKATPKEFQANLDHLKANKKKEHGGQSYIDEEEKNYDDMNVDSQLPASLKYSSPNPSKTNDQEYRISNHKKPMASTLKIKNYEFKE